MNGAHTPVFPVYSADPSSHVSAPTSPFVGMVLKRHLSAPVRASKARTRPGTFFMETGRDPSRNAGPIITTFSNTTGGELLPISALSRLIGTPSWALRSTTPWLPNASTGFPVFASRATSENPGVTTKIRLDRPSVQ